MPAPTPSLFAPKWEKQLYRALIKNRDASDIAKVGDEYADARNLAATFEAIIGAVPNGDLKRARDLLVWVFDTGFDPSQDPFVLKYAPGATLDLDIADGVSATLPLDRSAIGLLLAEVLQSLDEIADAVRVVEALEPSTLAAVSLAELYSQQGQWEEVVTLTDGLTNVDEPSTYLLIQRAIALREQGFHQAAREALKESLRVRSRPLGLRHRAYVERGLTHLSEGKKALARKDFERVLAQDSQYPGLKDHMAAITGS